MIWITGDTHGSFGWLERFCREKGSTKEDVMIILGDAGINYFGPGRDDVLKRMIEELPVTLLCIHGNHEMRPEHLYTYTLQPWHGGMVWQEELFPSLLFARDGDVYDLDGVPTLVIGGAYSIDRQLRAAQGEGWWKDEQPSEEIRRYVGRQLDAHGWHVGAVLSHTTALSYEPVEVFRTGFDQSKVDKSTEAWLDTLERRMCYGRWFCGHYHTDKDIDRFVFLMHRVLEWRTANGLAQEPVWNRLMG
ncbi:MAG: metallophosphoesterase [Clostridia bacterium]|nr:metallophosphoesterase [Clostridia bacterium]